MKVLNRISVEDVVALDIETVRLVEKFENLTEDVQEAWESKNKFEGEVPDSSELAVKWERSASLHAEFAKICAVSLALVDKQGNLKVKSYASEDEMMLLLSLRKDLNAFRKAGKILCAHAGKYFDYPTLAKRYMVNSIKVPDILDASAFKPWEHSNIDTNELWKSFGTGPGSSLVALAACLGLPSSKVDLVGDEVGKAYFNSELPRIAEYCNLDAITCMNVFLRFKGHRIYKFDEVVYANKGQIIPPLLTGLRSKKKIDPEDKEALRILIQDLDEKSYEQVKDILHAALHVDGNLGIEERAFLDSL